MSARSSSIRISSTTISVTGMITLLSRVLALSMSSRIAEAPPTSASAPSTAWTLVRTGSTVSKAALVVESTVRLAGDEGDAVLDDRLARVLQVADAGHRARDLVGLVGVGHDHHGRGVVGQAVGRQDLLALHRVELLGVGVLGGQAVGVQREDAEDADAQQQRWSPPRPGAGGA